MPRIIRRMGLRGRKLEKGIDAVQRIELSLDELSITMLKVVGRGSASRGARLAARLAFKAHQQEPDEEPAHSAPQALTSTEGKAP